MSLHSLDQTRPNQQLAMFKEIEKLAMAVRIMGPRVGKIAVFDASKLYDLAQLIALNKQEPGTFAQLLIDLPVTNKNGKKTVTVRSGRVKQGLLEWSQRADLMRGWKKKSMAAFFNMSHSDKRLEDIASGITAVCKKHLGLRVGWHKSAFRVLTEPQLSRKQDMRRKNVEGNIRNGEEDNRIFQTRGALPQGPLALEMTIYPLLEDDTDDEPN